MSLMQTIDAEVNSLVKANQLHSQYRNRWKYLLESYLGGEEYRQAGHLTRYQLETDSEYHSRLMSTPLDNHCQSVVSVYKSFLFRECPERDLAGLEQLPETQDFLDDADFEGRDLDSFMKEVATWAAVFGHCWIIMAKPSIAATTRADEIANSVRPYVNVLSPLVVLDWSWSRKPNGRFVLDYLRYVEDVNGDIQTIKEWTNETIRTSVHDVKNNQVNSDVIEPNGLGRIPAVICYNNRSTVRGIGVSAITDIADAQKFIYNLTSESEQSIRLDSHPSLVKTPETQAGTGAGSIIHMPENLDPGLRPYLLEYGGASLSAIYDSIKHTITSIDKMANTGAVRANESRTMSGVAMETEFQLLNARLSEMADNLELAEEQLWELFAEYQGASYQGSIEYPGSFNIRDTQAEIDQLVKVKNAATDPRVIALVDHELVEFLGEDADIILPETVTLATGETVPYDSAEPFEEPEEMFNPATGETGWVIDFASKREAMLAGWVEKK